MTRWACLVLLTLPGVLLGLATEPPFTFPTAPVVPQPPPPAPVPGAVPVLTPELLYVVNGNGADSFALVDPPGLVAITKHKGPITFRGKFVDKPTTVESRTYPGPVVYEVTAVATGRVYLNFVAAGAKSEADVGRATIDVKTGVAPQPPPGPDPAPPDPKGFRVIFVYETSAPLTPAVQQVMFGEKVRTYLDSKTVVGAGGKGWRRWDKDVNATNEKDADIKALYKTGRPFVTAFPGLIIAVDGKAYIYQTGDKDYPFPPNEDAALELFKKYGG